MSTAISRFHFKTSSVTAFRGNSPVGVLLVDYFVSVELLKKWNIDPDLILDPEFREAGSVWVEGTNLTR